MELSQIRYFVAVAQTLHFTQAAEACGVSQPALTKAIQKLEEELGGPLFVRERSRTQLTELGRTVLGPLERALTSAQDAKMQAAAFRRRETSPLRIGLEYSVPTSVLTPVMTALRRHNDDIELSLRQGSQSDLCKRMLAGEIDMAMMIEGPELNERLHQWQMFAEHYVLICQPDHPFGERSQVSVAELASECLLLNDDSACPVRRFIVDALEHAGIRPRRLQFGTSQEQLLEMVKASLGVLISSERTPSGTALLRRKLAADPGDRTVVLTAVAGRRLGPTAALFLKLMRARAWALEGSAPGEAAAA